MKPGRPPPHLLLADTKLLPHGCHTIRVGHEETPLISPVSQFMKYFAPFQKPHAVPRQRAMAIATDAIIGLIQPERRFENYDNRPRPHRWLNRNGNQAHQRP